MGRLFYRVFMSIFLVLFLTSSASSMDRKADWAKPIYRKLRWMQTSLCFWQNWGMFAPPPGSTSWLVFEGTTKDGETVVVDPLFEPLEDGFWRWRYDRYQKLSMSAFKDSRKALRRAIATNRCNYSKKAGVPLKEVKILRDRTWVHRPKQRLMKKKPKRRHKVSTLGTYKCR